ncbi:LOW QUALITY PROTEIN: hypothetical protein PHMEG_0002670 [Phytophthora megakarya]|uniref:Retrovirus-related Pol polyprotein from transposon TNT 1-94-like beta-barrel domain-containing protein n=1 Tax=Phytophthora megakarya TaxID=4795 RepID=A0A225WYH1_9STRA|nr:LOW QUALITY PROTEIN: hypothetical protein PHMEG_0002670 [Phytophthora megakarya]
MMVKYDPSQPDALQQASELVNRAQELVDEDKLHKNVGNETVNAVTDGRKCHKYVRVGHIRRDWPERQQNNPGEVTSQVKWSLTACNGGRLAADRQRQPTHGECLGTAHGRHEMHREKATASSLMVTHKGTVTLHAVVDNATTEITLNNVYYAPKLGRNLMSYCVLLKKDSRLTMSAECGPYGPNEREWRFSRDVKDAALSVNLSKNVADARQNIQRDTLVGFRIRFGHRSYDTIERMAKDAASGIELTDHQRVSCTSCSKGKQTRAEQPKKDTGKHAPVDRVGGVICSDLKGPVTPRGGRGNWYLVNFVNHKSNYCRIFLTKTKGQAGMHFEHFLIHFEKLFLCKVHVLRTDGGAKYNNTAGVTRQKSEVKIQVANGKAERMHRTVMNMLRVRVGTPLNYWEDAADSAVLNTRSVFVDANKKNLKKMSQAGVIDGKIYEPKGYRVYLPLEPKIIITRHVKNIQTPKQEDSERISLNEKKPQSNVPVVLQMRITLGVWVNVPPGALRLHTKSVYKTKRDDKGEIERYKAHLVAC